MKLLIKAYRKKDISKLIKKHIIDKKGHSTTVWVKPEVSLEEKATHIYNSLKNKDSSLKNELYGFILKSLYSGHDKYDIMTDLYNNKKYHTLATLRLYRHPAKAKESAEMKEYYIKEETSDPYKRNLLQEDKILVHDGNNSITKALLSDFDKLIDLKKLGEKSLAFLKDYSLLIDFKYTPQWKEAVKDYVKGSYAPLSHVLYVNKDFHFAFNHEFGHYIFETLRLNTPKLKEKLDYFATDLIDKKMKELDIRKEKMTPEEYSFKKEYYFQPTEMFARFCEQYLRQINPETVGSFPKGRYEEDESLVYYTPDEMKLLEKRFHEILDIFNRE